VAAPLSAGKRQPWLFIMEPQARRVAVATRLRPAMGNELGQEATWDVDMERGAVSEVRSGDVWAFDHAFGPDVDNAGVFEACCLDVVRSFCNGFNGTVLTYGQTAAGKTHTMQGPDGVIPRAIEEVFASISHSNGRQFLLTASFLEIYNEQVSDLLTGEDVSVLEGRAGGQVLQGLSSFAVACPEDVLECVVRGESRRRVGETSANRRSSRSHALLLLGLESRAEGEGNVRYSQLSLGDLAGSEGLRHVELTSREQRREGSCINKSLLALTQVVHALSENGGSRAQRVGFRDSKLTRILQPSLGGNAQTVIICALAPGPASRAETRSTLDFASRARCVENRVSLNIRRDGHQDSHIRALERQLLELKDRVAALQPCSPEADNYRAQELSEENAALKRKIERLQAAFLGDSPALSLIAKVPTPFSTPVKQLRRRTIACSGEKERLLASPPLMLNELTVRVPEVTPYAAAGMSPGHSELRQPGWRSQRPYRHRGGPQEQCEFGQQSHWRNAVLSDIHASHSNEVARLREELEQARQNHSREVEYLTDELVEVRATFRVETCHRMARVMTFCMAEPLSWIFAHWRIHTTEARRQKVANSRNELLARLERCSCGEREVWEARQAARQNPICGFVGINGDEEPVERPPLFPAGAGALGTLLAQSAAGPGSSAGSPAER